MIRQAHKYLVGAMSGASLIAVAIVAFVLLVSAQVFHNWPIAALGDSDSGSVSPAQPVQGSEAGSPVSTATVSASKSAAGGHHGSAAGGPGPKGHDRTDTASSPDSASAADPGPSGSSGGSNPETPGGGGSPEGGGAQGSQVAAPSSGASGSTGGGAGGSGGFSGSGSSSSGSAPTGQLTGVVNETVHQVDQSALGGALEKTGVTELTEGVVNGVVGPESTVGHAVNETVGAVNGLLGGKH